MENEKRKGLIVYILKNKGLGDCSNGGISSKHDEALLVFENGEAGIFEESDDRPTIKLVKRMIWGEEYVHVEPIDNKKGGGFMAGGCFVTSSDSRFSEFANRYPVSLHDRQE